MGDGARMVRVEVDLKERRVKRKAWRSDWKFTRWKCELVRDTSQTISKPLACEDDGSQG